MQSPKLGCYLPKSIKRSLGRAWRLVEKLRIEWLARHARINPAPIFVLGNQKSGTSAIAVLLAEMTGLSVTKDLVKGYLYKRQMYPLVRSGELLFSTFIVLNRLDFSRDIVKEANLTIFYDDLVSHFPASRFVFVLRDPRDNIRSQLDRLGLPGNLRQLGQKHRRNLPHGWDLVIDGTWLGLRGANYIEMLAARWSLMADVYLKNRATMFLVRYENFMQHKIAEITRLAQQLGLSPTVDITDKIDIPFQPPGNSSVKWHDFFGDENLARIEDICKERMRLLGYQSSRVQAISEAERACNSG